MVSLFSLGFSLILGISLSLLSLFLSLPHSFISLPLSISLLSLSLALSLLLALSVSPKLSTFKNDIIDIIIKEVLKQIQCEKAGVYVGPVVSPYHYAVLIKDKFSVNFRPSNYAHI